jgi:CHAT domain-containing protein/tetratricopeptide (TPR) repeat protein
LLVAVLAALAGAFATLLAALPALYGVVALAPGATLGRFLAGGAVDSYQVSLRGGDFLQARVDQHGVDVVVALVDAAGSKLLVIDSPNGKEGPEQLAFVARHPGRYCLQVRSLRRDAAGAYRIGVEALRRATPEDRERAAAVASLAQAEALRAEGGGEARRGAFGALRAAVEHFRRLGDARAEMDGLRRLARAAEALGDPGAREAAAIRAMSLAHGLGDGAAELELLNEVGNAVSRSAARRGAEDAYLRLLAAAQARGDRFWEAMACNNLGLVYAITAETQKSLDAYVRALTLWQRLGDAHRAATTLHNLGSAYSLLGRPREALGFFQSALRLQRTGGDRRAEAATLTAVAWVHHLLGEEGLALGLYDAALRLRQRAGDRRGEAATLDRRGTTLLRLGRPKEALASYEEALRLLRRSGDSAGEASTWENVGWVLATSGNPRGALGPQQRALDLFRLAGDRHGEADALLGLARSRRLLGQPDAALGLATDALHIVEGLRERADEPNLRISYLASRQDAYELTIDLLFDLHARRPGQGLDAKALEISERARARSLLDGLAKRTGASFPRPLGVPALQQLLDDDTLLLEVALGDERSVLWVVGPRSVVSHRLPGRAELEARARAVRDLLSRSRERSVRRQAELAAASLSQALLGLAAAELGTKRLLIVPDGVLQLVPFAALPDPSRAARGAIGPPLLEAHEIVVAPSASVLAVLRQELASRRPSPGLVAVVADPVVPGLVRLPWTRREADAILRLVPPRENLGIFGSAASRDAVLSGRLSRYRFVHFATHGRLNAERPELSGLVLTPGAGAGRQDDGFLSAREIRALDLPADLVTLSACRTAFGAEVRGEGLLGLAHGFLAAGAARALVSLWNVDDQATAELMERLYRGVLKQGLPPSTALRAAQLSLRRDPRWEAPYF